MDDSTSDFFFLWCDQRALCHGHDCGGVVAVAVWVNWDPKNDLCALSGVRVHASQSCTTFGWHHSWIVGVVNLLFVAGLVNNSDKIKFSCDQNLLNEGDQNGAT
jgi:hypothetical protein